MEYEPYDAQKELILLKKQSVEMQDLLNKNRRLGHAYIIKKLDNCYKTTKLTDNRIDQQKQSCDSPYCPICTEVHKIRREMAIAKGVVNKIFASQHLGNGKTSVPTLRIVTLTGPRVLIGQVDDALALIKQNYKAFLNTEMKKESGKIVSIQQSLLGNSAYFHISLSDDYLGNPTIGVDLHAIWLLKPSFATNNSITRKMIKKYWRVINAEQYSLETTCDTMPTTYNEFRKQCKNGLKRFDFDEIIANPKKFVAVMPYLHKKKFSIHNGALKQYRKEVRDNHDKQRINDLVAALDAEENED